MPVEFALRPRIRLREDLARPRRARVRLPRFALPVAAYWLAVGGIVYAFVHTHVAPSSAGPVTEQANAAPPAAQVNRAWWQRTPAAPAVAASPEPTLEPTQTAAPELAPQPEPATTAAPELTPPPPPRAAAADNDEPASAAAEAPRARTALAAPARLAVNDAPAYAATRNDAPAYAAPRDDAPAPPLAPTHGSPHSGGALPSCEAALANAHQDIDFSHGNGSADLPTQAIASVLENGAWLSSCNLPASSSVEVCVAIRGGNVIGASVSTRPADAALSACIRSRAAALQFPFSSHVDIARTRF